MKNMLLTFLNKRHRNSHMILRQPGNTYYHVKIETCIHHTYFFLIYGLDVDLNRKKRHRNSLVNCKISEAKCVCVCIPIYTHRYIYMYT